MIFLGEIAATFAAFLWSANAIVLSEAVIKVGSFNVNIGRLFFVEFSPILFLGNKYSVPVESFS